MSEFGKIKTDTLYYNEWHNAPANTSLEQINKRRERIGLNSYAMEESNELLMLERRKNKTANSEIIME
jgi:hypothetical protein